GALTLTRNDGYEDTGTPSVRLTLHLGPNIPVTIARELDVKVDDGKPTTGVLRVSDVDTDGTFPTLHAALGACIDTGGTTDEYDIQADAQDCGVAFLY
ncbi:MAG TPA: hypothetical protein VLN56_01460, partial [Gammaproteobacteria bacterium]|nr:hypothetical protein [Gammaproteobacteria bacterium]